jgi:hypothetical protein
MIAHSLRTTTLLLVQAELTFVLLELNDLRTRILNRPDEFGPAGADHDHPARLPFQDLRVELAAAAVLCGIGLLEGQRLSMADYVRGPGATRRARPTGGR